MKLITSALVALFLMAGLSSMAQAPSYDEIEFEPDSMTSTYKASGKNFVFIRSKRGTSGVDKTANGDALAASSSAEISEIVLVFSETSSDAIANRDEYNRERWENLLKSYPEFFQFSTSYKNLCQCNNNGDAEGFKQAQGFYVYFTGDVQLKPEAAAAPVVEKKAEEKKPEPAKTEAKKEEAKVAETKKAEEKLADERKPVMEKEVAVADKTAVKSEPPPVEQPVVKEKQAEKETVREEAPVKETRQKESATMASAKEAPKKKTGVIKARKAKDSKACRTACYGGGDEDLYAFFKDNMKLTKKQRRKAKKQVVVVKLQLNVDGSIKKSTVTGPDEKFNMLVQDAVNAMNPWNATVKGGVTVKSEVKITLKYDKATKAMKPSEVAVNPRLAPKCKCVSDSEMFN